MGGGGGRGIDQVRRGNRRMRMDSASKKKG